MDGTRVEGLEVGLVVGDGIVVEGARLLIGTIVGGCVGEVTLELDVGGTVGNLAVGAGVGGLVGDLAKGFSVGEGV